MSRARYDRSFDVYTGPGTAIPYDYKFSVDGRLVPQSHVSAPADAFMDWDHWITWNGPLSSAGNQSFDSTNMCYDVTTADVWHEPVEDRWFTVMVAQLIQPRFFGIPYRRALVLETLF